MRFGFLYIIAFLAVLVFLFGAAKLPTLAKSVGKSINIFKKELKTDEDVKEIEEQEEQERADVQ